MNQPFKYDDTPGGVMAWFTRNPVAANLLMFGILAIGLVTAWQIRTEAFPAFPPKDVSISIDYLGGSPQEVEEGVAIKVEEALQGIQGIQEVRSTVTSSNATITVTAVEAYPLDKLKDDIKLQVDSISTFPAQVESTIITEQQEERQVLTIEVHGETDHRTLKETARRVRDELLGLPQVNKVETYGERAYEINIDVSDNALRQYNLSFADVAQAVQNNSLNLSGGELKTNYGTISLRTEQQRYHGEDFKDIVVRSNNDGGLIYLRDVASIRDGFEEQQVFSRFNGQPSVSLPVRLLGDDSITEAADAVKNRLAELRQASWLPQDVKLSNWNDESEIIRDRLSLMSRNALSGIALVMIMLALFLNVRVAAWVALGIPVAFAGTFILMGPGVWNLSLNSLTTFGFIVVLGIVVDDAIVIGESIFSEKEKAGKGDLNRLDTTIRGASRVAVPATFGVLTTVAAFYPLTLIKSDFGQAFGAIALIVIAALLFSLVESKWILPAHLAHLDIHKESNNPIARYWKRCQQAIERGLKGFVRNQYLPVLKTVIQHRYTALCGFIALLILVVGLVPAGIVRSAFFPNIESGVIQAELYVQKGLGAAHTDRLTRQIEQAVVKTNEQLTEKYQLPKDAISFTYAFSNSDDTADIYVQALGSQYRNFAMQEVINTWRENIGELDGLRALDIFELGPGDDAEIEIRLGSNDPEILSAAATKLKHQLAQYNGVDDIESSDEDGNLELSLALKDEARVLGLSYSDIAQQLRNAVFGVEAQRFQRGKDEIRVRVRYPEAERNAQSDLNKIRIRTGAGGTVPLETLAELDRSEAQTSINRINGQRIVEVMARTDQTVIDSAEVVADLEASYFNTLKAEYPGLEISLSGEATEHSRATSSLVQGFMLALIMIYALLAIPLKSYSEPLVIMAAIPFGIIGAILGHLIVGIPLSLLSFFGVLALSGVVVNDSLVLASRYNSLRQEGLSFKEAIIEAGTSRFRAILLTSLTTFMGLVPLLTERSTQAQFLIPMAVSLAFGILFATVITLLIIPVLLGISHDLRHLFDKKSQTKTTQSIPMEETA